MILFGKNKQQIIKAVAKLERQELIELLWRHVTLEQKFTPAEVAAANRLSKRVIVAKMKAGEIRANKPLENGWRAPHSALLEWDEQTATSLEKSLG